MADLFDDPIADLLSEGSNDSFFEDPKPKTKKATKSITNVFDLDDDLGKTKAKDIIPIEGAFKNKPDPMESLFSDPIPKPKERRKSIDDINDLLEIDPKTEPKKSKSSVMNEILGISSTEEKKVVTFDDIFKSSKVEKKEPEPMIKKPIVELKTESLLHLTTIGKESRRGRRGSVTNLDPLGLLEGPSKSPIHEAKTKNDDVKMKMSKSTEVVNKTSENKPNMQGAKSVTFLENKENVKETLFSDFTSQRSRREGPKPSAEHSGLPDWLKVGEKEQVDVVDSGISFKTQEEKVVSTIHTNVTAKPSVESVSEELTPAATNFIDSLLKQQKLTTANMEIQNSSLGLQQQESQLMMALQLKKYEQNLADMQRTQQDILFKQEQQFMLLIEKQLSKQQVMEDNMRLQQERINNHIQLLLSQPVSPNLKHTFEEHQHKEEFLREMFQENRNFYNDIIRSLKQKHNEEIEILEESYKKQIHFLETSLQSTEERLTNEIESITKYFHVKLTEVASKNEDIINEYELKIKKINEHNDVMMQELKNNYNDLIKGIKEEYQSMIEDVNISRKREEEVISNSGEFTEKLNSSIEILKNNTIVVNELQMSVKNERNLLNDLKTESLNAKEQEIKTMKQSLEKQRLAIDNERAQLLALVRTLELKLVEQTQAAREEQWTLQQATATIAARALAMDREVEYIKNNLEFERQQLKTLKEKHLAENQQVMQQLTEEKLAIATEKARLETTVKLSQSYDVSKGKAEIEAALQVAREATEATDRERLDLIKQKSELEILKRNLVDREKNVYIKEDEIRNISKIAEQKYKEGERYMVEARTIESKCGEKMREVQRHAQSLAMREKKLAEEKIAISKERLAIHATENRCSLCKVDAFQQEIIHEEIIVDRNDDLELIRLRYELDDNVPTSERENDFISEK